MKYLSIIMLAVVFAIGVKPQTAVAQSSNDKIYEVEQIYYFDELDYAFYQAYNAFLSGHDAWAGARLKRAAYFVRAEATNARAHNRRPIMNQARRLEALADSVALGLVQSPVRLRRAFGRTHHVLANDYKLRAAQYWSKNAAKETGHAMVAAAGHVGYAAKWTGTKIEQGVVATGKAVGKTGKTVGQGAAAAGVESYRGVRWLGGKMIKGIAFVPEQVGKGLGWLGKGIDKVGKEVEPKPSKIKE